MASMSDQAVIDWLLEGDPAIRWQVRRDLLGAAQRVVEAEQRKVATEGWGKALLEQQAADGSWGGGLYTPKWTSTFYTLLLLTAMGLPGGNAQARAAASLMLDKGLCADGGLRLWGNHRVIETRMGRVGELCETGMGLRMFATYLGDEEDVERLVECLLETQLDDGGWNCDRRSRHGSFHTSICALEGLRAWIDARGGDRSAEEAEARGREFLLAHRMFRSHRTGEVVKEAMTRFTFPYHWHYDVLRGLDYVATAGAARDERVGDAMDVVERRRKSDGRWRMQGRYPGREYFVMEANGEPSRWNTLRALRVLRWWEQG